MSFTPSPPHCYGTPSSRKPLLTPQGSSLLWGSTVPLLHRTYRSMRMSLSACPSTLPMSSFMAEKAGPHSLSIPSSGPGTAQVLGNKCWISASPLAAREAVLTCGQGDGVELHTVKVASDPPLLHHRVTHGLVIPDVSCRAEREGHGRPAFTGHSPKLGSAEWPLLLNRRALSLHVQALTGTNTFTWTCLQASSQPLISAPILLFLFPIAC